jgi:hypothetical protein
MNRRQFGKTTGIGLLAVVTGGSVFMEGCSVFADIVSWTNIAGIALDGIVTVLGSFMPAGGLVIINAIKAFLTDLAGAATEYQNDTNPADKATLLAKIRTLLADIATNFQSFLQQINLGSNPIINVVIGIAQVILGAIMGFMGQLPAGAKTLSATMTIGGKTMPVVPRYYKSANDFKRAYNDTVTSLGHPEIQIH